MKMKRFMASLLIAVMVISTTAIGAFAAVSTQNTYTNNTVIDFSITCNKSGDVTTGNGYAMKKEVAGNIYFAITTCSNSTGKSIYASDFSYGKQASNNVTITGTGIFYSTYKSGYGDVGVAYYPAAKLSSTATTSARIAGGWHA